MYACMYDYVYGLDCGMGIICKTSLEFFFLFFSHRSSAFPPIGNTIKSKYNLHLFNYIIGMRMKDGKRYTLLTQIYIQR